MLEKTENDAGVFFGMATGVFLVGALLTTALPAIIETSWRTPTAQERAYTSAEQHGKEVYTREGCWYCHTQQIRTLVPDTKRYGWRGVDAPISTPGEYTRDAPHLLGTRRVGPDLARVGGKYDESWHRTHFRNPRDLVPGSVMPPFPWLLDQNGGKDFSDLVAYLQTLGRTVDWRPNQDYER